MLDFLAQNLGTILITLGLAAMVFLIIRNLVRGKKQGKGCAGCSSCSGCQGCGHHVHTKP